MYLFLTQCFPSRLGGIESLVSNLALSLSEQKKIIVFADKYHLIQDALFDNKYKKFISVRRYGGLKFFRRRKKVKELKLFLESNQLELVIADTWKSLEFCIDYLNNKKIPVMCLAHGNELLYSNNINKKNRIISTLSKTKNIIANSSYTASVVKDLLGNKKEIKFVLPGANDLRNIDSDNFFNIKGDPVILTLGRLEKRKGHKLVLHAIQKIKTVFPNIKYLIAGEGKEKQNLIKLSKEYNVKNNVDFIGSVNESQKKFLFENIDLMIMPTIDDTNNRSIEGFGIAYIEAAFFGIPSLVTNVGGTTEAVLHDKTGIVVNENEDLANTIIQLISKKDKLRFLGKNAKDRAISQFNWKEVSKKYISLLEN